MKKRKYLVRDLESLSQDDNISKLIGIKLKLERDNIDGIGNDIKFLREKMLGELQEKFAEHFKVGQTTISQWESGERTPSGPVLIILDQILDQIIEEIVEWKVRKEISLMKSVHKSKSPQQHQSGQANTKKPK